MTTYAGWWVVIARAPEGKDMALGPYPDEDAARLAMDDSLLVQSELDPPHGGTDCWIQPTSFAPPYPKHIDIVLVDLDDWTHTGQPGPDDRPPIGIFSTGVRLNP